MSTAAQVLVECLRAHEVAHVFGVPGESYLAVLDAMFDQPDLRFTNARHEGGATFMAAALAKLTGRPGVAMVTRGPGATNASIGVHSAMQDSTPLVLFIGQIARTDTDREAFQEIDYRAMFGPIAKWVTQIDHADRVPEMVGRAFATATGGRPGPVVVALPEDMLRDPCQTTASAPTIPEAGEPSTEQIERVADMLSKADRPLVIAGGGGWDAEGQNALQQFAECWQIPVAVTFRSQDLIDNGSLTYIGDAGLAKPEHMLRAIDEADVILALGIRFGEILTDGFQRFRMPSPDQTVIHVHASSNELGKVVQPALALAVSQNTFIGALSKTLPPATPVWAGRTTRLRAAHVAALDAKPQPGSLDMAQIMRHLRAVLPSDVIVTNGAGNFTIWPNRHLHYGKQARMIAPQSGSMGYGVPAAVAASIAYPDRMVLCFAGDGDFQMTGMELATAAQEGATPIVLVLNNGSYGTIRMHQERDYPTRVSGTQLKNPDFAALGAAFGFPSHRVEHTDEFAPVFDRMVADGRGGLIELVIAVEGITPGRTITELRATRTSMG